VSQSYRKRPFAAYCGGSQKQDKRICNRIRRRSDRVLLSLCGEEALFLRCHEALNRYSMSQDGTRHYAPWSRHAPPDGRRDYRRWYRWVKAK